MNFSGQHAYISLSCACSSFLFPQISGEADEWHLTLPSYTVDWLDIALYHRYTQLHACAETQAFPEAKSAESVGFTRFIVGENCDQTYLNLQFYFIAYFLLLLNTGSKEFIEIKRDKSICFQTMKSLSTGQWLYF